MGKLLEDIKVGANKVVQLFELQKTTLDYSIKSFIEIDDFFNKNSKDGKAKEKSIFSENLGVVLFCFGSYVGETIIKVVPGSVWVPDEIEPNSEVKASVKLPNGTIIFPVQKIIKRFKEGSIDSIYPYGYEVTKDYLKEPFDERFWKLGDKEEKRPWWKRF
jgi:hypothetical protein